MHDTRIQGGANIWEGPPPQGPSGARRGKKLFCNDRNLSDGHSGKSKRVVSPSNRRQKLLAQARPERRRADPHQREGTIPRRDMGAAAPTYRLFETYRHKMTKSRKTDRPFPGAARYSVTIARYYGSRTGYRFSGVPGSTRSFVAPIRRAGCPDLHKASSKHLFITSYNGVIASIMQHTEKKIKIIRDKLSRIGIGERNLDDETILALYSINPCGQLCGIERPATTAISLTK